MKTKTGILALGLFTLTGVVVVSCGGSSDSGDDTSTAGTTSTTSGTGTGGSVSGNSSGGTVNNTGGTANNTSGTANNTSGTDTGGTNTNGGRNNNNGGAPDAAGGAPDNAGGAGPAPGCPATQPADGDMCTQQQAGFNGCDYGTMNCRCRRPNGGGQNQPRQWQCMDQIGAGGAGNGAAGAGNFGNAVCPTLTNGQNCTGLGQCPGGNCVCFNGKVAFCQ